MPFVFISFLFLLFLFQLLYIFRRRGVLAWNHWDVNDGDIQAEPYFNACNTVVGREDESDTEDTYRPDPNNFKVKRKRFLGHEEDFISKFSPSRSTAYFITF